MFIHETVNDTRQHKNGRRNESIKQLVTKALSSEEGEVIVCGPPKKSTLKKCSY